MAESSFSRVAPEAQTWESIGLASREDGKLTVPSALKEGPIGPRVRSLLALLDLAVAAHNKRVDEIAELKGQQKTASVIAAGDADFRVTRKLGGSEAGTFIHGAGPAGVVESRGSERPHVSSDEDPVADLGYGSDSQVPCS